MRMSGLILKQSKAMLENKQYAILCAAILSIVPLASWLSIALVCLITLRKGAKDGFEVMLPAMVIHSIPLMMWLPLEKAGINVLAAYVPCYLAALTLRATRSWQAVFGVLFIMVSLVFVVVSSLFPEMLIEQFNQFKSLLSQYSSYQEALNYATDGLDVTTLGYLFFGVQLFSVVISSIISLMFARSIQAKLFMPNGFRQEVIAFRGNRISFLFLLSVTVACYYELPIGIFLMPFIAVYFLLAGFNLAYFILASRWQFNALILLLLVVLLKPTIVLLAYILLGTLDSLINFRLYLPNKVREST